MKISLYLLLALLALTFVACDSSTSSDDDKEPAPKEDSYTLFKEIYNNGILAKIYVEKDVKVGFTKFHTALFDSATGNRIEEAMVSYHPLMDMGMHKHAAPYEQPTGTKAIDGLFSGNVTFIMSGMWSMMVMYHPLQGSSYAHFNMTFDVAPSQNVKMVMGSDSMKYFITLIEPMAPKVGMNDYMLAINYKQDMMQFPAKEGLTVEIEPTMPSMGHGSPNNENPVHQSGAHYKGKVNFTMTGDWEVAVKVKNGSVDLANTVFKFDF